MVGIARGSGGGRTLLLNAHMDTVGVGGHGAAVRAARRGRPAPRARLVRHEGGARRDHARGRRGGRGRAARRRDRHRGRRRGGREHRDERGSRERYRADAAIVSEPTEMRLALAHKGFVGFEIETRAGPRTAPGRTSAMDAIARMGQVLVGIEELDRAPARRPDAPAARAAAPLHASVIEGGQEFSSYPDRCLLKGERRTIPGEGRARRGRAAGAARRPRRRDPRRRRPGAVRDGRRRADRRARLAPRGRAGDRRRPVLGRLGAPLLGRASRRWSSALPARAPTPSSSGSTSQALERCAEIYAAVARELCA